MNDNIITFYDLMGLIKDGKAPKKIKINNEIYIYKKDYEYADYFIKDSNIELNYNYYVEYNKLNEKVVEILSEENDEQHIEMQFPDTFEEFIKLYSFVDDKEIYTNGCELIPTFRLKQWIDHKKEENNEWVDIEEIQVGDVYDITKVLNKLIKNQRKIIEKLEGKDE